MVKLLILILVLLCLYGYSSIRNTKYSGFRRVFPVVMIFLVCIFTFCIFLDMLRYQVGFADFFKNLFSGF